MIEVFGDLWDYPADWRAITTNGYVRFDGCAVMGRGCAREAALRFTDLPQRLGIDIRLAGNVLRVYADHKLIMFPVKHAWHEPASVGLILRSTAALQRFIASQKDGLVYVLPRPGCGNGQLLWEQVRPIVAELPDCVHVITKGVADV